jgi:glycosyltransferase involved in cell wall biosynthesis
MHLLYFHQHFSNPDGSGGTRSYEMARRLIDDGHSVTMICGSYALANTGLVGPFHRGRRRGMVDGIDVLEFDLSYSNHLGFLRRSWLFLKFALSSTVVALREPCDLVFATTTPLTAGIPGILARWLRRKPFVFEVRDLWPELPRAMGAITNPLILGAMSLLEWLTYRSADRCVALSPGIAAGIERRGVAAERIELIPNGCDLDLFGRVSAPQRPKSVSTEALLAIYAGTHGMANGLDAVLDAARELKQRGRVDIRLVLIGEGREKPRLLERARREALDNLLFLDPLPKRDLAALLAGADIGMQILKNIPAFYFGTSPNKFFDYLAVGLPVLNNYPGWVASLIEENACGFAIPPDVPGAYADALEAAADDRAALGAMGKRARALASRSFAREDLARSWVAWVTEGRRLQL